MNTKAEIQQNKYLLRRICMNPIKRPPMRIKVASLWQYRADGSFVQDRIFRAVRGKFVGTGQDPEQSRYQLRINEGAGR